jgi:hypothetical protein
MELQKEWYAKGEEYAQEINQMVDFAEKNGWENWKGKEPEDKREHLADKVLALLKQANLKNEVAQFRKDFPPAHSPIIPFLKQQGQSLEHLHFINNDKIVFISGTGHQKRQAYLLNEDKVMKLDSDISAIGKAKAGNVFAIGFNDRIITTIGWDGEIICIFQLEITKNIAITDIIPFNDGLKVLLVSSEGIYLISPHEEKLIHPINDGTDDEWTSNIDMENATLSYDNRFIVAGDQCCDHTIMTENGEIIGSIGPQSSYAHFCLFSKDDTQLITNSCHFYNGITIGVDASKLNGLKIPAYKENDDYVTIDDGMRVYVGLATSQYYILGDAYGYIKAFDKKGNNVWRHFLGSTISGMTISDDEQTLWVGSYSGMLHKLKLGAGHRDSHTIGNGNHYEEFRLLVWKSEPQIWKW